METETKYNNIYFYLVNEWLKSPFLPSLTNFTHSISAFDTNPQEPQCAKWLQMVLFLFLLSWHTEREKKDVEKGGKPEREKIG